jgi:hypothetical protein
MERDRSWKTLWTATLEVHVKAIEILSELARLEPGRDRRTNELEKAKQSLEADRAARASDAHRLWRRR